MVRRQERVDLTGRRCEFHETIQCVAHAVGAPAAAKLIDIIEDPDLAADAYKALAGETYGCDGEFVECPSP